ncbi:MAG: addiction module toxin RelE [Prevotella sp.]
MSFRILTTTSFDKAAKRLSKKYASFKQDLISFCQSLEDNPMQGAELYPGIRKIRMEIASKRKGKSGGARVITFNVLVDKANGDIILLLIYDKNEASTVNIETVKEIIEDLGFDIR